MRIQWLQYSLAFALLFGGCNCDSSGETPTFGELSGENCENGVDDNDDGLIDCDDETCQLMRLCVFEPPDPATIAPAVDLKNIGGFADSVRFLWEGDNPVIRGVRDGAISDYSVAVIRGTLTQPDGSPIQGVRARIEGHPELGHTFTRPDGAYDLVANGGGTVDVRFEGANFPAVDRQIEPIAMSYANIEPVVVTPYDTETTVVDLNAGGFHAATPKSDGDGTRKIRMYFQPGTTAEAFVNGKVGRLKKITVRATEYTVGDSGLAAMPAMLPNESAYTFAAELTIDEAREVGAKTVTFTKPVAVYVENFLDMPVGAIVPNGIYQRDQRRWEAAENGIVLERVEGGFDSDGDGGADDLIDLGATPAEVLAMQSQFEQGQTVWRMALSQFSPHDFNWPFKLPEEAVPPDEIPEFKSEEPTPCAEAGSWIECQNQTLTEMIRLPGTGLELVYRSDRATGYATGFDYPLFGDTVENTAVEQVVVEVEVAGQFFRDYFEPAPNLTYEFRWNGKDIYGRKTNGPTSIRLHVAYMYKIEYTDGLTDQAFGRFGGEVLRDGRRLVPIWRHFRGELGSVDAKALHKMGGWSLATHHVYDGDDGSIYPGASPARRVQDIGSIVTNYEDFVDESLPYDPWTPGSQISDMTRGPDGSFYTGHDIVDEVGGRVIYRRFPDGRVEHFAGRRMNLEEFRACYGSAANCGQGGLLTDAIMPPGPIAAGPDGAIYVSGGTCIWKLTDTIRQVIGDCIEGEKPKNQPVFPYGDSLAIGPTGRIFVAKGKRIFEVFEGSKEIKIIAGAAHNQPDDDLLDGEGIPALGANIPHAEKIVVGSDGTIYFSSHFDGSVAYISPDGLFYTAVRNDGREVRDLGVAPDGTVYYHELTDGISFIKRWKDGVITPIAGVNLADLTDPADLSGALSGYNIPATSAFILSVVGLHADNDGTVYWAGYGSTPNRDSSDPVALIKVVRDAFGDRDPTTSLFPSPSGQQLYQFDANGRHKATIHALTGARLNSYTYSDAGYLVARTDGDGKVVTFERDALDELSAIQGPYGHRTEFIMLDGELTEARFEDGSSIEFEYDDRGLLTAIVDPRGNRSSYSYDAYGRITRAEDPTGAWKSFRSLLAGVEMTTSSGRQEFFQSNRKNLDGFVIAYAEQTLTRPDGTKVVKNERFLSENVLTMPDNTVLRTKMKGDPRFGLQTPYISLKETVLPSGLTYHAKINQMAQLSDPDDLSTLTHWQRTVSLGKDDSAEVWTQAYDQATRTWTATSPEGRVKTSVIDDQGRTIAATVPGFDTLEWLYDSEGRLSSMRQGSRSIAFGKGADGFTNQYDFGESSVSTSRDVIGRPTVVTINAQMSSSAYDETGNLTGFARESGDDFSFGYDGRNMPQSADFGAGAAAQMTYSDEGDLASLTTEDGESIVFTYDSSRRHIRTETPQGVWAKTYNPTTGRLATTSSPAGETTLTYDGTVIVGMALDYGYTTAVTRVFDDRLRLSSEKVGNSNVAYSRDADGLLTQVGPLAITWRNNAAVAESMTAGTLTTAFTYSSHGETIEEQTPGVYGYALQLDDRGFITRRTESVEGLASQYDYSYDVNGRLTEVKINNVVAATYIWDDRGNLTNMNGVVMVFDGGDALVTRDGEVYQTRDSGRVSSFTRNALASNLSWDALGNIVGVSNAQGSITYALDAQERRVAKYVNGAFERGWVYTEDSRPIAEVDATGNVTARFVYVSRSHVPDIMLKGGRTYRLFSDHRGSVRLVVDTATGVVAQRIDYDEFGGVQADSTPSFQPFGYASALYDPDTGFMHLGRRDYDPSIGRFLSRDGLGLGGGLPNLYSYAAGDPVNFVDVDGQDMRAAIGVLAAGLVAAAWALYAQDNASEAGGEAQKLADPNALPGTDWHVDSGGNGPIDAVRHCSMNCKMTARQGESTSKLASWFHEVPEPFVRGHWNYGEFRNTETHDGRIMDEHNNLCGQRYGKNSNPEDCTAKCKTAFDNGELMSLDPSRWSPEQHETTPWERYAF